MLVGGRAVEEKEKKSIIRNLAGAQSSFSAGNPTTVKVQLVPPPLREMRGTQRKESSWCHYRRLPSSFFLLPFLSGGIVLTDLF